MRDLKNILVKETMKLFDDYDNQDTILINIDSKGNYVYAKLDEYLIRNGYPKEAI